MEEQSTLWDNTQIMLKSKKTNLSSVKDGWEAHITGLTTGQNKLIIFSKKTSLIQATAMIDPLIHQKFNISLRNSAKTADY